MLVVVLTGIGWWASRTPAPPAAVAEPVSVLIANFRNDANEPLFDGLVEQALGVGIESASFVSAYPRRDALRLVPAVKRTTLDEETARLIAIREGIDRILSGSIAQDGSRYKLAVRIIDPQAPAQGSATLTLDTEAKDKNDVLNAVGRMAGKVRNGLGDVTVDANQVPAPRRSPPARSRRRTNTCARRNCSGRGSTRRRSPATTKAIELDKDLGRAYAGLGAVSNSLGRRQEAEEFFKQALKLLSGMTDREKYRTRSAYFLHTQNPVKAREELEALVAQFPADSTALNNLAVASWQSRDMARALELGRKASAIYPNNVLRRNNVALFAMYAGDFATAEQEALGVLKLNPDFAKAYFAMAMSQLATGRPADAEATWQQLKAKPTGFDLAAQGRADMAVYEGRLADAAGILEEALAAPPQGRSPSTTARLLVSIAEVRELQGRGAEAIRLSEEALATVKGSDHGIVLIAVSWTNGSPVMVRCARSGRRRDRRRPSRSAGRAHPRRRCAKARRGSRRHPPR